MPAYSIGLATDTLLHHLRFELRWLLPDDDFPARRRILYKRKGKFRGPCKAVDYVPTDLVSGASGVANMAERDHFRMDAAIDSTAG